MIFRRKRGERGGRDQEDEEDAFSSSPYLETGLDRDDDDRPSRRIGLKALILLYALAVVAIVTVVRKWGDLETHWAATALLFAPRWIYAVPAFVLGAFVVWRERRWARWIELLLLAGIVAVVVSFMDVRVSMESFTPAIDTPKDRLRVFTYNIGGGTFEPAALVQLVADLAPDVAGFEECGSGVDEEAFRAKGYTYRKDGSNICLLTKLPIVKEDVRDPSDVWKMEGSGGISRYELAWKQHTISIELVHLETVREGLEALFHGFWHSGWEGPEVLRKNVAQRDFESKLAIEWLSRGNGMPSIVMGDFNIPPDSQVFKRHWSGFHNALSEQGGGMLVTKATKWHGIRIDHVLSTEGLHCEKAWVAEDLGMDHRPVVAEFTYSGAQAQSAPSTEASGVQPQAPPASSNPVIP